MSQIFRLLTVKFVSKIYKLKNRTHISSLIVYPVLLNPRLLPFHLQSLWSWRCCCFIFSGSFEAEVPLVMRIP